MSGKKAKANDYLNLIFSDMVYEDFKDSDEDSVLSDIFNKASRFKDDPKYRKNRLEVNYTAYEQLSDWEFLRKEGENNLERDEQPNGLFRKVKSVLLSPFEAATDPDFLALVTKQVPLFPMVCKSIKGLSSYSIPAGGMIMQQLEDLVYSKIDRFLEGDLGAGDGFYAAAFVNEADKEIIIAYRGTNETRDHTMTNSLIAAGIPSE